MISEEYIRLAAYRVARIEKEQRTIMTQDQMRAALTAHFQAWDQNTINGVVISLHMTWGAGAFYMAKERRDA